MTHTHLLEELPERIPPTDIPYFSNKKEEHASGHIACKALSREKYLSYTPAHTAQDGTRSPQSVPRPPMFE